MVGAPPKPGPISVLNLIFKRSHLGGSAIGGIRETQEMLDFCGDHGITSDLESADQRGLCAFAEGRRKVRFCDRHGVA
jgi:D-arabinose 1-dehydrogenase-like Zn-dependent alcohol dehydrogenase